MLFQKKINVLFLFLMLIGNVLPVNGTNYSSWAKQKMRDAREKVNDAYVYTCEKTRALYEKAKENKKLIAGLVVGYLGIESILKLRGKHTLFARIFTVPGELNNVRNELHIANNDLQTANNDLTIVRENLEEIRDLERELRVLFVQQGTEAREQIQQLERQIQQLRQENEQQLNITNQNALQEIDRLSQELRNLTQALRDADELHEIDQQDGHNARQIINQLHQRIEYLSQAILDAEELNVIDGQNAQQRVNQLNQHIEGLNQELEKLRQQVSQYDGVLENKDIQTIERQEEALVQLRQQLQQVQQRLKYAMLINVTNVLEQLENSLKKQEAFDGRTTTTKNDVDQYFDEEVNPNLFESFRKLENAITPLISLPIEVFNNDIKVALSNIVLSLEQIILAYVNDALSKVENNNLVIVNSYKEYYILRRNINIVGYACQMYEIICIGLLPGNIRLKPMSWLNDIANRWVPICEHIYNHSVQIVASRTDSAFEALMPSGLNLSNDLDDFNDVLDKMDQETAQILNDVSHLGSNISNQSFMSTTFLDSNNSTTAAQGLANPSSLLNEVSSSHLQRMKALSQFCNKSSMVNNQSVSQSSIVRSNNSMVGGSKPSKLPGWVVDEVEKEEITASLFKSGKFWNSKLPATANRDRRQYQDKFIPDDSWMKRSAMSKVANFVVPKGGTNSQFGTSQLSNTGVITNKDSAKTHSSENDKRIKSDDSNLDVNYVDNESPIIDTRRNHEISNGNNHDVGNMNNVSEIEKSVTVSRPILLSSDSSDSSDFSDDESVSEFEPSVDDEEVKPCLLAGTIFSSQ